MAKELPDWFKEYEAGWNAIPMVAPGYNQRRVTRAAEYLMKLSEENMSAQAVMARVARDLIGTALEIQQREKLSSYPDYRNFLGTFIGRSSFAEALEGKSLSNKLIFSLVPINELGWIGADKPESFRRPTAIVHEMLQKVGFIPEGETITAKQMDFDRQGHGRVFATLLHPTLPLVAKCYLETYDRTSGIPVPLIGTMEISYRRGLSARRR